MCSQNSWFFFPLHLNLQFSFGLIAHVILVFIESLIPQKVEAVSLLCYHFIPQTFQVGRTGRLL